MKAALTQQVNDAFGTTGPAALQALMLEVAQRIEALETANAAPEAAEPAAQ